MRLAGIDLTGTGKKLVREIGDDDVSGLAAELSYRFFLALFPFAIFLTALGGFIARAAGIDNPAQSVIDAFGNALPSDAASMLRKQVEEVVNGRNAGLLSFGIIGTIWAAAGGMGSLIKAMNRAYDIPETRPFWRKTLLAIGLTLAGGLAVVVAFGVIVATSVAGQEIADAAGLGSSFKLFLLIVRYPVSAVIVMAAVSFLYWAAPNTGLGFKWVTPGALFFTAGWLLLTTGFAFYVANFASYNATYGALGGVVVLLAWFNLTSMLLLIGAEINALVDEEKCGELLADRRRLLEQEIEKRRETEPAEVRALEVAGARSAVSVSGSGQSGPPGGAVMARPASAGDASRGELPAPAPLSTTVVTLLGLILAAFAIRRWAR